MLTIDIDTARRFVLGKQGLWPGRRWRGLQGTERAMRAMEYLQLDPQQIIARSQDIKLHSRVLDYTPGMWEAAAYQRRKFFDWGGWLAARLMDELPHWRVVMRRERDNGPDTDSRIRNMARDHADAIAKMRAILRERGTVNNRDFEMSTRTRTQSYRGRKDSALALYYLWRTGEVITHHRRGPWTPLETTTTEEAVFLAPLDHVSARGRAKVLFGFDYVWEVYKPVHQRKFGYYTLPILWGDRLVARFDSKLDRTTNSFIILGLWLEDKGIGKDEAFAEALGRGFTRFIRFLGASKLDAKAIGEPLLRRRLSTLTAAK